MVQKCKNCGVKIIKFPLWEMRRGKKIFLWTNLFKMSLDQIMLLIILVALVTSYKLDTAKCNEMVKDPLGYCEDTNACKILAEQQYKQDNIKVPSSKDLVFNNILETDIE